LRELLGFCRLKNLISPAESRTQTLAGQKQSERSLKTLEIK